MDTDFLENDAMASMDVFGEVTARLYERGKLVREISGNNLVVDGGLQQLALLLSGAAGAAPVNQMRLGAGTTWPTPPGVLAGLDSAPSTSPYKTIATSDITFPTSPSGQAQVQFRATWTENEANGFTIYEVGIFAAGPILIARYVFPAPGIAKSVTQTLVIDYLVTLQAS